MFLHLLKFGAKIFKIFCILLEIDAKIQILTVLKDPKTDLNTQKGVCDAKKLNRQE